MALKFFRVPVHGCEGTEAALNQFLGTNRILTVDRQFVDVGENSYWAICIDFLPGAAAKKKERPSKSIDYREVLSESEFRLYAQLREVRKELAAKDGVPVYAVLTNQQLADAVQKPARTLADLQTIDGLGETRVQKYGQAILDAIESHAGKAPTDAPTSQ